jgi:hypothetical protein
VVFLSGVAVALCAASLLLAAAVAASARAAETETLRSITVREAAVSIGVPDGWQRVELPLTPAAVRRYAKQEPKLARLIGLDPKATDARLQEFIQSMRQKNLLFAADVKGDGDNVVIGRERGPWWTDLADWRATGAQSARSTGATVLSDTETRIGERQAFIHLEQEPATNGGTIFGYMEIRAGKEKSFSISLTVDSGSRTLAEAILNSVATLGE